MGYGANTLSTAYYYFVCFGSEILTLKAEALLKICLIVSLYFANMAYYYFARYLDVTVT